MQNEITPELMAENILIHRRNIWKMAVSSWKFRSWNPQEPPEARACFKGLLSYARRRRKEADNFLMNCRLSERIHHTREGWSRLAAPFDGGFLQPFALALRGCGSILIWDLKRVQAKAARRNQESQELTKQERPQINRLFDTIGEPRNSQLRPLANKTSHLPDTERDAVDLVGHPPDQIVWNGRIYPHKPNRFVEEANLTDPQLQAAILKWCYEMPIEKAAAFLGISESSFKERLARARGKFGNNQKPTK